MVTSVLQALGLLVSSKTKVPRIPHLLERKWKCVPVDWMCDYTHHFSGIDFVLHKIV